MRAEHPTPFPTPFPTQLPTPLPVPDPMPGAVPDPDPAPEQRPEPTPGPTPDAALHGAASRRAAGRRARAVALVMMVPAAAALAACRGDEDERREQEAQRLARISDRVARLERLNTAAYGLCREALEGVLLLQPRAAVARREEVEIGRSGDTLVVRGWVVPDTTSGPPRPRGWTCTVPVQDTTLTRASVRFDS